MGKGSMACGAGVTREKVEGGGADLDQKDRGRARRGLGARRALGLGGIGSGPAASRAQHLKAAAVEVQDQVYSSLPLIGAKRQINKKKILFLKTLASQAVFTGSRDQK